MRQKKETATSFDRLKEITQAMQARENSAQTSGNANESEITSKSALKPTKKAFSERQKTTIRDNSQASIKETKGVTNRN
ncbi:hypothetical protein MPG46_04450 [Helicobacter pylori]|uniref:hypothetical protein n=1 Tax=Helicobacter pylori TaxID=210 RepID=UPI001FD2FC1B|nr:hypothetical protein [Helicobacter pylori]UOR38626.1 hypothetical protein MPG46_04450 [Helicobacter pylori]